MIRPLRTPPRWVRYLLAAFAIVVPCLVWGITTASADLSLGPHEARYDVTTGGLVVVDLGPLGTLEIDSPLPAGLGARVTVEEIPADLTAFDQAATLSALSQDLQGYLQFFSGPQTTVDHVTRALITDALQRTGLAIVAVGVAGFGLYVLLGRGRRRELSAKLGPRTWEITAGVVILGVVLASLVSSGPAAPARDSRPTSAVFAGTALEGARITGRLAGVVDTYGGQLLDAYRDNTKFYAAANDSLVAAWDSRAALQDEVAVDGAVGDGATQGENEPVGGATGADGPVTDDSTTGDPAMPEEDLLTLLVVSDLHCNTGMTPLIRTAAERSGATVILNAGDTTMNGTAVEQFCVNSFASAVPDGARMVVSDGNHDSAETSAQEKKQGVEVLGGAIVDLDGLRILGDRDALETRIGEGSKVAREETPEEQAQRLAGTACEADDGVDLLLIHTPRIGNETLDTGCATLQVSGHTHQRADPVQVGDGLRYVNGSTAGAAANQPTVGPLHGTAEMTVLRFDPETRTFVDWQLVEVMPDGTARVDERQPFPTVVRDEGVGEGSSG